MPKSVMTKQRKPMRSIFIVTMILFLLTACGTATATVTIPALDGGTMTVDLASPTPSMTVTPIPPTETATARPTENVDYTALDIERPLETCPVITDIEAYREWLYNSSVEPFGSDAILRPLRIWDDGGFNFDPNTDGDYKDQSTWSYRQSPNIVCYNSGKLKYLLLPTAWLNPNDRSNPNWTISGLIYEYTYGTKTTNEAMRKKIKAWLFGKPQFWNHDENFLSEKGVADSDLNDYLETYTRKRHPDIDTLTKEFIETGNAASVSKSDIILIPRISYK
jgi:hypothetical protein